MRKRRKRLLIFSTFLVLCAVDAQAQVGGGSDLAPSFGSITTPHPINPADGTTNPSAAATQSLNPYLGSTTDDKVVAEEISLSLQDAIGRGEKFNLGLVDSQQADARTRAEREHALSELLPQISARAEQTFQQLSFQELGIKLPKSSGLSLPPTSGAFGYSEARVQANSPVLNVRLLDKYRQQKILEQASILSSRDARDVVAFAVGEAYFQVIASQARLKASQAALTSAEELKRQVEDQLKSELAPEVESLKAEVQFSTAQQRVVEATNDLEKDKLTLDRIAGIPLAQRWTPGGEYGYRELAEADNDDGNKAQTRFDLASAKQEVSAAEVGVRAARAERLPSISLNGSYGGGGTNPANYNQVYLAQASVDVPIFTSGRIRSDVHKAEASLVQRRAEYNDLQGRVQYDVRIAQLDVQSSTKAVTVALQNSKLADKALEQSEDRYKAGVTDYLEVLQAEESRAAADENYVASLFSFNVSKLSLARALGSAESHLHDFFETN